MTSSNAIPVLDLSDPALTQAQIAHDLVSAAAEHGFVYIRNTDGDIAASDVDAAFALSRTLFALPLEEKQQCAIGINNRGWSGMHSETLDPANQKIGDFKEAFNFGSFPSLQPTQPIPPAIQRLVPQLASFRSKCHSLCLKLLHLFGIGLEVSPPSFFADSHDPERESGTILRHLYYPPPAPSKSSTASSTTTTTMDNDLGNPNNQIIRAGAHSDYGSLTLLFRLPGQPGLQVLTKSNVWVSVPVVPPGTETDPSAPILINIGDLLSYWTGGLLRSTIHRVVFPSGIDSTAQSLNEESDTASPRYSIAFFCHPAGDTELRPVPSERVRKYIEGKEAEAKEKGDEGSEAKNPYAERKVMTADEHLQMRLRASYLALYQKDNDEPKNAGED